MTISPSELKRQRLLLTKVRATDQLLRLACTDREVLAAENNLRDLLEEHRNQRANEYFERRRK